MSTTEVGEQKAGQAGGAAAADALVDPDNPAVESSTDDSSDWFGVPYATWRHLLSILTPGLLYLAIREVGLLVLGWMTARNGTSITNALTSWDGEWYLGIASGGYGGVPPGMTDAFGRRTADTPLAFFPGYPTVVRWVGDLPGVSIIGAAFTVSLVCGVICAYGLVRLCRLVGGNRLAGVVLVVLFAASPMAIVLSMAYSEAMFCALAVWALVGVLDRKWLLAGLCAVGTGLVRPSAAALVVTVMLAAAVAIVRRRDGYRPWLGLVLAPVGLLAYLGVVAHRTGQLTGWFALQRSGWNSTFDGGVATVKFGLDVLASGRSVLEVATVAILVVAVALLVISVRQRLAWPVVLYGALVFAMDVGSNGLMNSKARLLLPAFTLLVPMSLALAKRRPGTVITVLAAVTVASAWFGAYSITGWQYAI